MNYNKQVDEYISKSADFAKPLLNKLRDIVHQANPEITETIKWGFPCFEYKGIVCSMQAFKNHCSFGFMKASMMSDPQGILEKVGKTAMGSFGKLQSESDLPDESTIISYVKEACALNESGVKETRVKPEKKELTVPDYFLEAINQNPKARETFEKFSYSHKKEYVEWVTEAKKEETRLSRMQKAIEMMAEGMDKNSKYKK